MRKVIFLPVLMIAFLYSDAQRSSDAAFFTSAMTVIKPAYKSIVLSTAANLKGSAINTDSLANVLKKNRQLASLSSMDVEAMIFLVLGQVAKEQENEIKELSDQLSEVNKNKVANRGADSLQGSGNEGKTGIPAQKELTEQRQLKLQTIKDQRTRAQNSMANLRRKFSEPDDDIIKNLK